MNLSTLAAIFLKIVCLIYTGKRPLCPFRLRLGRHWLATILCSFNFLLFSESRANYLGPVNTKGKLYPKSNLHRGQAHRLRRHAQTGRNFLQDENCQSEFFDNRIVNRCRNRETDQLYLFTISCNQIENLSDLDFGPDLGTQSTQCTANHKQFRRWTVFGNLQTQHPSYKVRPAGNQFEGFINAYQGKIYFDREGRRKVFDGWESEFITRGSAGTK